MSIDLNVLREDLEVHKTTLQKHTKGNQLGFYSRMFGLDAYVLKVEDYKNGIDQLETVLHLFDSNIINEAFKKTDIKVDADEFKHKNKSNQKLIDMIADILKKLNDHKTSLDKIKITISE